MGLPDAALMHYPKLVLGPDGNATYATAPNGYPMMVMGTGEERERESYINDKSIRFAQRTRRLFPGTSDST